MAAWEHVFSALYDPLLWVGERGGMEVATVLFDVGKTPSRGLLYRTPDGKVQEFLFSRN
jgi:hypothetical protein